LGVVSFRPPGPLSALAETPQGFVAVAATLLAYGVTELLQGYGFLAVFVAAVALRRSEPRHQFHAAMHAFIEQTENLLVVALLLLFGGALVTGVLAELTWRGALVAVLLVLVVRPITGRIGLVGTGLTGPERWAIAFFGIRGFGSVYYLAYALGHTDFAAAGELWAIVALAMLISIGAHGISATPAMSVVDRSTSTDGRGGA
jgi:NhaP-type Na+/H+ or K+/H+ antiporter